MSKRYFRGVNAAVVPFAKWRWFMCRICALLCLAPLCLLAFVSPANAQCRSCGYQVVSYQVVTKAPKKAKKTKKKRPRPKAPAEPQAEPMEVKKVEEKLNFGINTKEMEDCCKTQRYFHRGKEITKDKAYELVQDKALPDDTTWLRLTLIGSDGECKTVLGDLPLTPELSKQLVVQSYRPTDWAVSRYGFKTDGHPTVYLQKPDGEVLLRQDAYEKQPLIQAVRKARPDYDPKKDPDGKSPSPAGGLPVPLLILGGLGLALVIARKT